MEGGDRVLSAYPPDLSEKAEKLVTRLGVQVMKGVMATCIDNTGVTYKRGDATEKLAAKTVIWSGGVMTTTSAEKLAERTKAETDRSGSHQSPPGPDHCQLSGNFCSRRSRRSTTRRWQAPSRCRAGCHSGGTYAAKAIRAGCKARKICRRSIISTKATWLSSAALPPWPTSSACTSGACPLGSFGSSFT